MIGRVPGLTDRALLAARDGSEVWRARWRDGSLVAVKILTSTRPDRVARFEIEGRILVAVGGRCGLVGLVERLTDPLALVLEYLPSGNLRDRVREGSPGLTIAEGCRVVARVAEAAAWLHRNDIIHRDIKPSNILLGERDEVRLTDLGVAAWGSPARGSPSRFEDTEVGTLGWAAPELLRQPNTATVAVDVYGLGATIYELLTGHLPYDFGATESTESYRTRIRDGEPAIPIQHRTQVPAALAAVVNAALATAPDHRPESAEAFGAQLLRFA